MTEKELSHIENLLNDLDEYWAKCLLYGIIREWDYDKAIDFITATHLRKDLDDLKEKGKDDSVEYYSLKAEWKKLKEVYNK